MTLEHKRHKCSKCGHVELVFANDHERAELVELIQHARSQARGVLGIVDLKNAGHRSKTQRLNTAKGRFKPVIEAFDRLYDYAK
jgi:hypothetical protein